MQVSTKIQSTSIIYTFLAFSIAILIYIGIFWLEGNIYAADYGDQFSDGDRTSIITVTESGGYSGTPSSLVDGNQSSNSLFGSGSASGSWVKFELSEATTITEAKFYQGGTQTHGVHKWQGSNNDTDWTDIGSSFTLGGSSPQTQTQLSGNVTSYLYYRLLGVSGSFNSTPWIHEFEFGVPENAAPTATNLSITTSTDGTGNITITTTLDDADDDSLSLKIESKSGTCSTYSGQSTSTLSGTLQSTFGTPSVDNNAAYQISSAITSSGANTVTTTWQSATDFSSGDGTYCVFLTPYDGSVAGTVVSSTVVLDNVDPSTPGALTVNTTSTGSMIFDFGSQSSDTNFDEYIITYGNYIQCYPNVDNLDKNL